MQIGKIEAKPVENSINPEMMFEIEITIQKGYEVPLEIAGCILSEDNMKIANIYETINEPNRSLELSAEDQRHREEEKLIIKVIAPLNNKALDHIETLREKNPKGDVILSMDFFVKTLCSRTNLSHMFYIEPTSGEKIPYQLPEKYKDAKPVFYHYQKPLSSQQADMWILSGNGKPTFIEIQNHYSNKKKVTIPSSDWINDYCPVFKIGKFIVFECWLPDVVGSGDIAEMLKGSIDAIKKMEEDLIKGEWNQVIEDSRAVWELLKNQDEIIKNLITGDGYPKEASDDLNGSLQKLFDYSSKFHHKLDKEKKIMPEIKASKEDAYLIYSVSMSIVNLISKKMQRLNKSK